MDRDSTVGTGEKNAIDFDGKRFSPTTEMSERAHMTSEEYGTLYADSIADPEGFWGEMARQELEWFSPWKSVHERDDDRAISRWFSGGKINASYNCLDRHAASWRGIKTALIWQGESREEVRIYNYQQLLDEVSKFANVLKDMGVVKGDRVSIYLPMIPELPIAMLACARIGAVHNVTLSLIHI